MRKIPWLFNIFNFEELELIIPDIKYKYTPFYKEKIEIPDYQSCKNFPIQFLPPLVNDKILKYMRIYSSNSKNFKEIHKQIKNKDYQLKPHNRSIILYKLYIKNLTRRGFINKYVVYN